MKINGRRKMIAKCNHIPGRTICPDCTQKNRDEMVLATLEQENAKLKRDKKDQCIMYDDLHKKYTKVLERMTKAEAKLHNIEDGLRRLESFLYTGPDRSIEPINLAGVRNLALVNGYGEYNMSALTIAELINKLLIGGE